MKNVRVFRAETAPPAADWFNGPGWYYQWEDPAKGPFENALLAGRAARADIVTVADKEAADGDFLTVFREAREWLQSDLEDVVETLVVGGFLLESYATQRATLDADSDEPGMRTVRELERLIAAMDALGLPL